jgi:hypothetical protein
MDKLYLNIQKMRSKTAHLSNEALGIFIRYLETQTLSTDPDDTSAPAINIQNFIIEHHFNKHAIEVLHEILSDPALFREVAGNKFSCLFVEEGLNAWFEQRKKKSKAGKDGANARWGKDNKNASRDADSSNSVPPTSSRKTETPVTFPDWWTDELAQGWKQHRAIRLKKKAALTPYADELLLNKLAKLRDAGNDPLEVLNRSIVSGWTSFFPIKESNAGFKHRKAINPEEEIEKAARARFGDAADKAKNITLEEKRAHDE